MKIILAILAFGLFLKPLSADVFLYHPLPTSNLNNLAGANRSNAAFGELDTNAFNGDNFTLPAGSSYRITSIITWSVASILGEALGVEFNSISLYGRQSTLGATMQQLSTGTPGDVMDSSGNVTNSNPNILSTNITYNDFSSYEAVGADGFYFPVWRHVFSGLNWVVDGGVTYEYSVWGTGANPDPVSLYGYWFNHASNDLFDGVPGTNIDNRYLVYDFNDTSATAFARNPELAGLWDKGADMNIIIVADILTQDVPEPATFAFVGLALAGLGFARRYRFN